MIRLSALIAMFAVAVSGFVFFRREKPWHIVGTGTSLMLANVRIRRRGP